MKLSELSTPCLVLDAAILRRNCERMTARMRRLGVRLRPHLKTAKSLEVARIALENNFGGITVATLNEAEYFAAGGIDDLLYSTCVTPDKLDRVEELMRAGKRVELVTDDPHVARAIADRGTERGVSFHVHVEVDSGEHRTGVAPDAPELVEVARILHESAGTELTGVLTHAGHSYACTSVDSIRQVASEEHRVIVQAARRLREADLPCPTVSAGSTPTASQVESLEGVTEMRPGVFMFGDLAQVALGSCERADIAPSVLATVISHDRDRGRMILDAGALALSKDHGEQGYGLLVGADGSPLDADLTIDEVHQEHGAVSGEIDFARHPVGSRVRVLPNHACMTGAMYERYFVVEGSDESVRAEWSRTNGW